MTKYHILNRLLMVPEAVIPRIMAQHDGVRTSPWLIAGALWLCPYMVGGARGLSGASLEDTTPIQEGSGSGTSQRPPNLISFLRVAA